MVQAELATLAYPQIGSICAISSSGEPDVGRLVATAERLDEPSAKLGAHVFQDTVNKTALFGDLGSAVEERRFPLNHMDLGTQNVLADDGFNFLAVIDWEFAQTAPWQVNHYMPFPPLAMDIEGILQDPNHLDHKNVSRREAAREIYCEKFREAERALTDEGRALGGVSLANVLNSPASTCACFTHLGCSPEDGADRALVRKMVQLAFGLDESGIDDYIRQMKQREEASGVDG